MNAFLHAILMSAALMLIVVALDTVIAVTVFKLVNENQKTRRPFTTATIRYFDQSRVQDALHWLASTDMEKTA